MTAARTKTIAYLRVSTAGQAEHGVSLEAQRAKVEAYAELYDLDLVAIEVDAGASAKSLDRPALGRVLSALMAGDAEALLVCKLDRLTRSVRDLGVLLDEYFGVGCAYSLISVAEQFDTRTAAGRLVLNVMASVAQWERETIGERTRAAMRHKRANGEYTGGYVPYGYKLLKGGAIVYSTKEQRIIAQAKHLRDNGWSYRKISRQLAELNCFSRSGKPFTATQIKRLVGEKND